MRQLSNQIERKDDVEIDYCRRAGNRLTRYHRRNVMRYLLTTAAMLLCVTPCLAEMHLPPVEYDKPYPGKITIETVTSAQLQARCAAASQWSLGCSFPKGTNSCHILLVDEASMKAVGWTLEVMLRHERAHCNGWTQDHPGKRPYPSNDGMWR